MVAASLNFVVGDAVHLVAVVLEGCHDCTSAGEVGQLVMLVMNAGFEDLLEELVPLAFALAFEVPVVFLVVDIAFLVEDAEPFHAVSCLVTV